MTSSPLVSVLTPVYNGEKYLAECIESVFAQTYQNWRYDIIDNCSTDRSLEIAQRYAEKDNRICIHRNDRHVGRIENHNIAFSKIPADAKYCKMVHADDWLFPHCITQMVELMEDNDNVGIVGAYALANERVVSDGLPYPSTVVTGREVCRRTLLGGPYVFGSPTSLLFRADVIRSRSKFYNEYNPHADKEACFEALRTVDFGFIHQVLLYMRIHAEADSVAATAGGTFWLSDLEILKNYGRDYLSHEEFEQVSAKQWRKYYRLMAKMVLLGRSGALWPHHRATLERLGYSLDKKKVARATIRETMEIILDPVGTLRRLRRRMALRSLHS